MTTFLLLFTKLKKININSLSNIDIIGLIVKINFRVLEIANKLALSNKLRNYTELLVGNVFQHKYKPIHYCICLPIVFENLF